MKIRKDYNEIVGMEFGRLKVVGVTGVRNHRHEMLLDCLCTCGKQHTVPYPRLKSGNTKSCGCLQPDVAANAGVYTTKHGDCYTSTYASHRSMMRRCYDPNSVSYKFYGARGVTVCERWRGVENYENFKNDMGERPHGTTLDRFPDNKGNYEPGNCRWATPAEQARNFTNNRWITIEGESLILVDWANRVGLSPTTILDRLKRGWSELAAITTPPDRRNTSRIYIVSGKSFTLKQLSALYGVDARCIRARLQRGIPIERALSASRGNGRKGQKVDTTCGSMSFAQMSAVSNIPTHTILERLARGWTPDEAMNKPLQIKNRKSSVAEDGSESVADNLIVL